jgi:hypothetical protein
MNSLDEYKLKPSGTMTASERMVFACFGFYEAAGVQITAPVVYDALGNFTDLLQVTGASNG